MAKAFVFAGLLLVAAGGCQSGPEERANVSYRASAKENFLKGMQEYEDEDYLDALEFFKFVKSKFPYSTYATDADLMLAECQFMHEKYLEAADAYLTFIKLHPKHTKVPYATLRIGESYFKRIPEDWWFAPPAHEMDQREAERAALELKRFLERFPKDENAPRAQELYDQTLRRLAAQVLYVMNFNRKGEHWQGVLWRAEQLLRDYPGPTDEEALLRKAEALAGLGQTDGARKVAADLLARFPKSEFAAAAQQLVEKLVPTPAPAAPGAAN